MVLILLIELSRHNCHDSKEKRCISESFLHVLLLCVTLQLKEMVLALLHESDLILSDEYVEQIVDKVQITVTCHLHFHAYLIYIFKISCLLHRLSMMQIQMVMEGLTQKSGRNLYQRIHP